MGILKYTVNSKQPERRNMQLLPNFQKGERISAWKDLSFYRGVSGKEDMTFSRGGCSFYIKRKIKSEIFNDKKKFINKNVVCHN